MALEKLDAITGDLNKKGVAIAQFISNIGADPESMKKEKERLAKRQAGLEGRVKWMNEYLKGNIERCGIQSISCPYFSIKIKECPLPRVEITDETQVPDSCKIERITLTPNKTQMSRDMQEGAEISGARLVGNMAGYTIGEEIIKLWVWGLPGQD